MRNSLDPMFTCVSVKTAALFKTATLLLSLSCRLKALIHVVEDPQQFLAKRGNYVLDKFATHQGLMRNWDLSVQHPHFRCLGSLQIKSLSYMYKKSNTMISPENYTYGTLFILEIRS
jgi:hypothetical protein